MGINWNCVTLHFQFIIYCQEINCTVHCIKALSILQFPHYSVDVPSADHFTCKRPSLTEEIIDS